MMSLQTFKKVLLEFGPFLTWASYLVITVWTEGY